MILEKFVEALSSYEKEHLLSLLKNDERIKQEELRKLIETNKTTIDVWADFKFSTRLRDIIALHFAKECVCLNDEHLKCIDNKDLKRIRNLGIKAIIEFNEFKPKN
jgi:hypothetical protein